MFDVPPDAARPGMTLHEMLHNAQRRGILRIDVDQTEHEVLTAAKQGKSRERMLETASGRFLHVLQQPMAGGAWVVTYQDVTERRRAELERDRNREFLDRVVDNIPSIVIVKDAATRRFVLINKAGEDLWGLPRSSIVGRTAADFFSPERAAAIDEYDARQLASETDLFIDEHPFTPPDGPTRYVTARTMCIRAGNGTPQYLLAVLDDVTERRSVRHQLALAQKMEAVGRLTGGLAHDFNNLLLIMIGNLDLLAGEVRDNPSAAEQVEVVLQSSLHGAELTRQLLAFSRRQSLTPKRLEVNALVESTTKLLQRSLGESIVVELRLSDDLWPVRADESQLESAIVNIAINARDAMPNGGRLVIETRNTQLDKDYCDSRGELIPGEFVVIEITDAGTGMPPDVLSQIFEPFFTTKGPGEGTGLGLSSVFGFMRQSGGDVTAYSEVGIGTTFKLYLPRAEAAPDVCEPVVVMHASAAAASHETILVVEDNPTVRAMVVKQLSELGYAVMEAENAMDALECLSRAHVDLMFTDMVMPGGINGKQLAWVARLKYPDLKILFTSGFPGTADVQTPQLEPTDVLLRKPYRKLDLACAVRDMLDGAPSSVTPAESALSA
jgi:PAS domain S-box-containing protein